MCFNIKSRVLFCDTYRIYIYIYIYIYISVQSSDNFLDILRTCQPNGLLASLNVDSLFTNVPVEETIKIITQYVYNHDHLQPLKIPKTILIELLKSCTMKSPFRSPDGKLFLQKDGIAMGSPLGPTFAGFYMGHI